MSGSDENLPADDLALCGRCAQQVRRGSLRCAHCGAPFAGPNAEDRLRVDIDWSDDGVGAQISIVADDTD